MNNNHDGAAALICDPVEGICGDQTATVSSDVKRFSGEEDKIEVLYFTDPICSSCWGIEPQLKKLKTEYGSALHIKYVMGGLLPDWNYNSGGISGPKDVAVHWDEVSLHYDMPIDGDIWLEDPLNSSYPPSIAFKAAQMQDNQKAVLFMRELRELLFLQKENITKWEVVETAGRRAGLVLDKLKADYEGSARAAFEADLALAQSQGVRGFPTMIFINNAGDKKVVYGSKPYAFYEMAVLELNDGAVKAEYSKDWQSLFSKFRSLTAREYAELSGTPRKEAEKQLETLTTEGKLSVIKTKNGSLWRYQNKS